MPDKSAATILVVDDNPVTLYSTSRVLQSAGFGVLQAENGLQAVELSKNANLVVLDVNLPDINGFEVCRRIRETKAGPRIPVIHLSATFVKDMDKVFGLEIGADGYLTHPVEPPVLVATINALLRTREAEAEMRLSEAKFKAVFDKAPSGIALVDKNMVFTEVNGAMCKLLRIRCEELSNQPISNFVQPERRSDVAAMIQTIEEQGMWQGVLPLIRSDGKLVQLEWNISSHSMPGACLAVVTDITERLEIEKEREQLLGSERAARADAEQANRLKDEFLATLSHELRTPLNAIVGWSQLLKRRHGDGPPDMVEGLTAIERNAKVQTQLISDLLDVSRITSGKLRLEIQQIDPSSMMEAALAAVMAAAEAKEIAIVKVLDPFAGPILGDPSRLQQVLWNLINNAVKFTPKGGRIQVQLRRVSSQIEMSVTDNGQGIKSDLLPFIFERFRQGDATTTRGHGGLGLGLAIAKHLVEMHGGVIYAESEGLGKGSTFTVRIPISPVNQTQHGDDFPHRAVTPQTARLQGVRVLIVDDDKDARNLMHRVLNEAGADVHDIAAVPQVLNAIKEFNPNILVSDIGMPDQDGYELIRQVRENGISIQQLPAIALTAFARSEDRRRALLAGFQVHVAKPVEPGELIATIESLVGRTG